MPILPTMFRGLSGLGTTVYTQPQIAQMVVNAANQYGVPPSLALGIASHESGFNPNATNLNNNGTTDWGVMQLNDKTVKTLGVSNPLDPQQNIDAGVQLLGSYLQKYNGDTSLALQAYASGPGTVASGSAPNSTASSFISYVQNYTPPSSLGIDLSSLPPPSNDSSIDSISPDSGSSVDWTSIALIAGGALLLMAFLGNRS